MPETTTPSTTFIMTENDIKIILAEHSSYLLNKFIEKDLHNIIPSNEWYDKVYKKQD